MSLSITWMRRLFLIAILSVVPQLVFANTYVSQISFAFHPSIMIINSELFRTYNDCSAMQTGDNVIFMNKYGPYFNILNLRTQTTCLVYPIN